MRRGKYKNQLNIYKEFWDLANQADDLANTGNYDVDMLISAWRHQLTASNFFYVILLPRQKLRWKNLRSLFFEFINSLVSYLLDCSEFLKHDVFRYFVSYMSLTRVILQHPIPSH